MKKIIGLYVFICLLACAVVIHAQTTDSLTGYYSLLGQEDINWGFGNELFSVATGPSTSLNLTKVPALTAGTASILKGKYYVAVSSNDQTNASTEGTLAWIAAQVGSANADVEMPAGTYTFGANYTVPSNINLLLQNGAFITLGNFNLTLPANFHCPRYQVFAYTGTGVVTGPTTAYPEWWGAVHNDTTNDQAAIQDAINEIGQTGGGIVDFMPGVRYAVYMRQVASNDSNYGQDASAFQITYPNITLEGHGRSSALDFFNWNGQSLGGTTPGTNFQVVTISSTQYCVRGSGIWVVASTVLPAVNVPANFTVDGLEMNGGTTYTGNSSFPASPTTGDGWDETNTAIFAGNGTTGAATVNNCYIHNFNGGAIYQGGNRAGPLTVTNNTFANTNGDALSSSTVSLADNNIISTCAAHGIEDATYISTRVSNNTLSACQDNAINILYGNNVDYLDILNNTIIPMGRAIQLIINPGESTPTFGSRIAGNIINVTSTVNSTLDALVIVETLYGNINNCDVENNHITIDQSIGTAAGFEFIQNGGYAFNNLRVKNNSCLLDAYAVSQGYLDKGPFAFSTTITSLIQTGNITDTGIISPQLPVNAQTGTTYTILGTDHFLTFSNASAVSATLPACSAANATNGDNILLSNLGAGTVTVSHNGSDTIIGNGTSVNNFTVAQNHTAMLDCDGSGHWLLRAY